MDAFVWNLLHMSVTAGWMVLALILVRLIFRKAPHRLLCLAWALVAVRLLFPFSLPNPISLIPDTAFLEAKAAEKAEELLAPDRSSEPDHTAISPEAVVENEVSVPHTGEKTYPEAADASSTEGRVPVIFPVWITGVLGMLLYAGIRAAIIYRRIRNAIPAGEGIYRSEGAESPFIFGIIRPRIYFPANPDITSYPYVIAHEKAHLARKDHWWKPFGYLLLSVYWFNPLLWAAYLLFCRDIEYACDESAVQGRSREWIASYADALVAASSPHRSVAAHPLAFGEAGVKKRIELILRASGPSPRLITAAVAVIAALVLFLLTDPVQAQDFAVPAKASETGQKTTADTALLPEKTQTEEQSASHEAETEPGLSALTPAEDWIFGTDYGEERNERLLALLEARSAYVKDKYLANWYMPKTDRATLIWKAGQFEITDPEKLDLLATLITPEKLYASVLIPEIYDLSHKEGDPASREFQRSSSLYSSYGAMEDLLLDLHNGTYIAVLFSSGDKDGLVQLRIGQEGAYNAEDGIAEIVPAQIPPLPFLCQSSAYMTGREFAVFLAGCMTEHG